MTAILSFGYATLDESAINPMFSAGLIEKIQNDWKDAVPKMDSQGKTILSVENDQMIRDMIVDMVESLGHRCLEAANARTAMEIVETQHIDLLLLDIHMPAVRGH